MPGLPAGLQKLSRKFVLHQRIAAGYGHPATGTLVVFSILLNDLHNLFHSHVLAPALDGLRGTGLHALSTADAFAPVNAPDLLFTEKQRLLLTDLRAKPGISARKCIWTGTRLAPGRQLLTLRIAAPFAPHGTSLHENLCPDAGSIIDGKLLDIKNNSLFQNDPSYPVSFVIVIFLSVNHIIGCTCPKNNRKVSLF